MTDSSPFQPIESSRLSDEAVRQIKGLIEEGMFKPNDKLPSERQLVQELGVSRTSIREALRTLEGMGLIEVHSGIGAYVVDRSLGSGLSSKWKSWMAEHHQEVDDLLEIREALEPKAASLAAERILPEQLTALAESVLQMKTCGQNDDVDGVVKADVMFHDLISQATRNETLIELSSSINHILLESRYVFFQDPGRVMGSVEQHREVVDAIAQNDPDSANRAMLAHVQRTRRGMQKLVRESDADLDDIA